MSPPADHSRELLGMARLTRMGFEGQDLRPTARHLIARAEADTQDANALLDLSTVLYLMGRTDLAYQTQIQALSIRRDFDLPARDRRAPFRRLLALMTTGDLMVNAPLPLLLEGSDIELTLLYLLPDEPLPERLPQHEVLYVAISESDRTQMMLQQLQLSLASHARPLLNQPARIAQTGRDHAHRLLAGSAHVLMPTTDRLTRQALGTHAPADTMFPLIIRPVDSHAGNELDKIDDPAGLNRYLAASARDEFFVARFIDYRSGDGLYRKYRIVLIQGRPYAGHMAVSTHWMIHYLNADMTLHAGRRAEEAGFMAGFDSHFAARHAQALTDIAIRFGLDYLVIDCAEAEDGRLIVFEVDPGAVIHLMDPQTLFPYKQAPMQALFTAFRDMVCHPDRAWGETRCLASASGRPGRSRPDPIGGDARHQHDQYQAEHHQGNEG